MKYSPIRIPAFLYSFSISLLLAPFLFSCSSPESVPENEVVIRGTVAGATTDSVFLSFRQDDEWKTERALISEDKFEFRLTINETIRGSMKVRDSTQGFMAGSRWMAPPPLQMYLEPGQITEVIANYQEMSRSEIKGGAANTVLSELKSHLNEADKAYWEALETYYTAEDDTSSQNAASTILQKNWDVQDSLKKEFFDGNSNSVEAAYFASFGSVLITDPQKLDSIWETLGSKARESFYGKEFYERAQKIKLSGVGSEAPDFTKNQPDGTPFQLSTSRGKIVMVDFWGSWCGPCRAAHPHMKELYDKYKEKGFEIVGVASENLELEVSKEKWVEAIKEDDINWIHVLNEDGIEELDVVDMYGVNAFPTSLLLDRNGVVLMRMVGAGGTALDEKLEELFSETED